MPSDDHRELHEMIDVKRRVDSLLRSSVDTLSGFLKEDHIDRLRSGPDKGMAHKTATAFCLYYLAAAGLLGDSKRAAAFTPERATSLVTNLGNLLVELHREVTTFSKQPEDIDMESIPNQYLSPICMAGYLCAWRRLECTRKLDGYRNQLNTWKVAYELIEYYVEKNGGWVPQLGSAVPSAYLTYWASAALSEYSALIKTVVGPVAELAPNIDGLEALRKKAANWLEAELANHIAFHHAGDFARFDIIELIYAAIGCLQFDLGNRQNRVTLAQHGLALAFDHHFSGGVFRPSAPVFADKHAFSFRCPTVEAMALVLLASKEALVTKWRELAQIYAWLERNKRDEGWFSEWDGRNMVATSYTTASAIAFLKTFGDMLDWSLCQRAKKLLDVPPDPPKPPKSFAYPKEIGSILQDYVIGPLKNPDHRRFACYSMILYGPPGSSKTTIAKKLASDLDWPLEIINQSEFLASGIDQIDAEASRIFHLVKLLTNVVVLFDEVEELVQSRTSKEKHSRLLTTAMLPRIHDLRDQERVVFIFATNYFGGMDSAAVRLGRFDIIRCIMPPDDAERDRLLFSELLKESDHDDSVIIKGFREHNVLTKTSNFGYKDLQALVNTMRVAMHRPKAELSPGLIERAIKIGQNAIDTQAIAKFEKDREGIERP